MILSLTAVAKKGITAAFGDRCFIGDKTDLIAAGDVSEDLYRLECHSEEVHEAV